MTDNLNDSQINNHSKINDSNVDDVKNDKKNYYYDSSQFKHWRFSLEDYNKMRLRANEVAIERTKSGWMEESTINPESQLETSIKPPTVEEENDLIIYYLLQLKPICNMFRFPEIVEATTITYIKRFYLFNSVIDVHPKRIMLTALFLATKTVNTPISCSDFAHYIGKGKISTDSILQLEFFLSQNLRFEFSTHPAHRATWGIYLDMQTMPQRPSQSTLDTTFHETRQLIRLSRQTPLEFLYSPSQIALGCFKIINKTLIDEYINWKIDNFNAEQPTLTAIEGIINLINEAKSKGTLPKDKVQEIDKKLKLWQDPSKVQGTEMYKRKQEQIEAEDLDKRNKRALEAQKSMNESSSVFGEPLPGFIKLKGLERQNTNDDDTTG